MEKEGMVGVIFQEYGPGEKSSMIGSVLPPVSSSAALIGYLSSSSMLEMKTLNGNNSGGVPVIGSVASRSNMSGSVDSSDTFATCNTHPFLSQEELESNLYVNPFDNGKDDKMSSNIMIMMGANEPVMRPTTSCGVLKDPGSPWGSPTKKKRDIEKPQQLLSPKTRRTRFQHAQSEQTYVSTKKPEMLINAQQQQQQGPSQQSMGQQQQVKMLRKDMPAQQSSSSTIVSASHDSLSMAAAQGMVSEHCSTTCPTTTSTTGFIDAPPPTTTKPKSRRPSFLPTKGIASATKLLNQHFFGNTSSGGASSGSSSSGAAISGAPVTSSSSAVGHTAGPSSSSSHVVASSSSGLPSSSSGAALTLRKPNNRSKPILKKSDIRFDPEMERLIDSNDTGGISQQSSRSGSLTATPALQRSATVAASSSVSKSNKQPVKFSNEQMQLHQFLENKQFTFPKSPMPRTGQEISIIGGGGPTPAGFPGIDAGAVGASSSHEAGSSSSHHYQAPHQLRFHQQSLHPSSGTSSTGSPNVLESSDSSTISPGTTVSGSTVLFNRNETQQHHQQAQQQLPPPLQPFTINKLSSFDDFLYADCSPLEENTQNNNIKTNPFNNSSEES
ncbi:unnamed protein product [Orchesella dallaii]|uniref:Uncharacterized protein n=1 Tax=Orchesella dallaii TaxID=48710 RepID=A0ABP1PMB8_9HEXA